jgi:ergothioneine biosynthesis protein EgtB
MDAAQLPFQGAPEGRDTLLERYERIRGRTEALAEPLSAEDQTAQAMLETSPTKWHRAHTSWFFEALVLKPHAADYVERDPAYAYLFNSYYQQLGPQYPRPQRGALTRPGCAEVAAYRGHVDDAVRRLLEGADAATLATVAPLVNLGLHHEQQHQELLLMDILALFGESPLDPAYYPDAAEPKTGDGEPVRWHYFDGGRVTIGAADGFAYDNEGPAHDQLLRPFYLASRPVTNGEWLSFMADHGYQRPELWLDDGWATVQAQGWRAPRYWRDEGGHWSTLTLAGRRPVDRDAPVCHVSYYEADAFARWAGRRLPSEAEWEHVAAGRPVAGNLLDAGFLRPVPGTGASGLHQLYGDVWEWTASPYTAYPGYRAPRGAVGEYNGKFMCNSMVLRGGCCVTPDDHIRATYRNFFYPHQRWMFAGLRLADDA